LGLKPVTVLASVMGEPIFATATIEGAVAKEPRRRREDFILLWRFGREGWRMVVWKGSVVLECQKKLVWKR
jgi:hypothetical protein